MVTREQFEDLIHAISPKGDPQMARSFARDYPETLMFARKALDAGLDKDPAIHCLAACFAVSFFTVGPNSGPALGYQS